MNPFQPASKTAFSRSYLLYAWRTDALSDGNGLALLAKRSTCHRCTGESSVKPYTLHEHVVKNFNRCNDRRSVAKYKGVFTSLISSHLTSPHFVWNSVRSEVTQFATAETSQNRQFAPSRLIGRSHGGLGRFTANSVQTK